MLQKLVKNDLLKGSVLSSNKPIPSITMFTQLTVSRMNATEDVGWLDSPSKLDSAVDRVKTVKSLGLDVALDFHGRLHKAMAKQLA
jgi:hypothetical protein